MTGNSSVVTVQNKRLRRAKSLSHSRILASSAASAHSFIHSLIHQVCAECLGWGLKETHVGITQPGL